MFIQQKKNYSNIYVVDEESTGDGKKRECVSSSEATASSTSTSRNNAQTLKWFSQYLQRDSTAPRGTWREAHAGELHLHRQLEETIAEASTYLVGKQLAKPSRFIVRHKDWDWLHSGGSLPRFSRLQVSVLSQITQWAILLKSPWWTLLDDTEALRAEKPEI